MDLMDLLSHWIAPFISGFAFVLCITTWYLSRKTVERARKLREEAHDEFRLAEIKLRMAMLGKAGLNTDNLKVHYTTFDGAVLQGEIKDSYFRHGKLWFDVRYVIPEDVTLDIASVVVSMDKDVLVSCSPRGMADRQWSKGETLSTNVAFALTDLDALIFGPVKH